MASVNKKFAVEKGLEVGDDALVVDADNNKTGIGKTNAKYGLDVATTANFDAGDWYFQAVANKSGAEKQTIATGRFEVLAALSYSGTPTAFDGRSQVNKDLDLVEAAIRALLNNGVVQEYKIGNRTAKKYDLSELLVLKAALKAELVREQAAEKIANGLGNPRAVHVRFGA